MFIVVQGDDFFSPIVISIAILENFLFCFLPELIRRIIIFDGLTDKAFHHFKGVISACNVKFNIQRVEAKFVNSCADSSHFRIS
ncbi:unknown [Salmonella phage FelixO1]|uniref:Uncharacterized protein n=1 Tax=Salmonella phage Felix O1 (isolate Felix O1-VT1) TaxID=1283336 RepID=Q6KGQ5_BPFO1|nr:unknown [Salmonella phage FelixO1]